MTWLPFLASVVASVPGTDVTPIDTATSSVVSYIAGYGVLGFVALAFFFRFIVPASVLKEAREQGRADLKAELERVIAEKRAAEEQRDAALQIAQEKLVPLLVSFTASSSALIPLLQQLVADREDRHDRRPGR